MTDAMGAQGGMQRTAAGQGCLHFDEICVDAIEISATRAKQQI